MREHVADVQADPQRVGETLQRAKAPPPPPLPLEQHHVLDERRDQVGDLPEDGEVLVGVRVAGAGGGDQRADRPPAAFQGNQQAGAKPGVHQLPLVGIQVGEARIRGEIVHPHRLAGEHGAQDPLGDDVPGPGVEGGGVMVRVEQQLWCGMLGKHGKGPAVLVQVVHHEAVVGDPALQAIGELVEKTPGFELLLHGAPDRHQRGQQVGQQRVGGARQGVGVRWSAVGFVVGMRHGPRDATIGGARGMSAGRIVGAALSPVAGRSRRPPCRS